MNFLLESLECRCRRFIQKISFSIGIVPGHFVAYSLSIENKHNLEGFRKTQFTMNLQR